MDCGEVLEILSVRGFDAPEHDEDALADHLSSCAACAERARDLSVVEEHLFAMADEEVEVPPQLGNKVSAALARVRREEESCSPLAWLASWLRPVVSPTPVRATAVCCALLLLGLVGYQTFGPSQPEVALATVEPKATPVATTPTPSRPVETLAPAPAVVAKGGAFEVAGAPASRLLEVGDLVVCRSQGELSWNGRCSVSVGAGARLRVFQSGVKLLGGRIRWSGRQVGGFVVSTDYTAVRAVGTVFTVEHFSGEATVVAVQVGRVEVETPSGWLTLDEGQGELRVGPHGVEKSRRGDTPSVPPEPATSETVHEPETPRGHTRHTTTTFGFTSGGR